MTNYAEWVPANNDGLVWFRVIGRGAQRRQLGVIHALGEGFWRAGRAPWRGADSWRDCPTMRDAIDWVEVEP